MAIQRAAPVHDFVRLRESLNRVFEDALDRSASDVVSADSAAWRPALDLFDDGENYVVRADLPGVAPEEVAIDIAAERLTIRGERRTDRGAGREAYLRVERPVGHFALEIALPASVDRKRIQAQHHNGVLEIMLPKQEQQDAPDRIPIKEKGRG